MSHIDGDSYIKIMDVNALSDIIELSVHEFTKKLIVDNNDNISNIFVKAQEPSNKAIIECAMLVTGGNQSKAARILGLSRSTLRKYLYMYCGGIDIGIRIEDDEDKDEED